MPHTTGQGVTLATCCYCGAKGALCLTRLARKDGRRELTCQSCGAPLRALKAIPEAPKPAREAAARAGPAGKSKKSAKKKKRAPPPRREPARARRRRSWSHWIGDTLEDVFDEAFDVIEDLVD